MEVEILQILNSCKDAIQTCLTTKTFAFAHLYSDEKPMDMHIHDSYEIYYSISGGKQFLIDNRFYNIFPGDILLISMRAIISPKSTARFTNELFFPFILII